MICTGAIIDGKPPIWPFSEVCDTPDEGRAAVRKLVEAGVNQIKVYSRLKLDVYQAIAEESKKQNIKFVGHVPEAVTLEEAMKAGQYINEHLTGFGAEIVRMAETPTPSTLDSKVPDFVAIKAWSLLPKVERKLLDEFTKRVAESGMVQCPTLVVHDGISKVGRSGDKDEPRMKYVSPHMRSFWDSALYRDFPAHLTEFKQQMVGELHRAGATLIIGTDLANPYVFAGSAVHEEMELFAKAGISPGDVLKAATITPARVCGVADRLGTVSEGKNASLVLLRADPLEKISNAREIEAVFLRGQFFDRTALLGLLENAEQEASKE
jgi:imidazolonepropionase-like amidohydrolase